MNKTCLLVFLFLFPLLLISTPIKDYSFIYGKIKLVSSGEDYKVKIVDWDADLNIEIVSWDEKHKGKWKIVKYSPDYKIKLVKSGQDFSIRLR